MRHCQSPACPWYRRPYRPEEEGGWALAHGEFGLDVIALVGALRYAEHRSIPEIHRALGARGVTIAERSVTAPLRRYEGLAALRLADHTQLRARLAPQEQGIRALAGLQPDVGHEGRWVLRDCLSGAVLLARRLLGRSEDDRVPLLRAVADALPVPIRGVISDGQQSIRNAVRRVLPDVPHQRCQFHSRREAAKAALRGRPPRHGALEEGGARGAPPRAGAGGPRGRGSGCRARLLPGGAPRADRRRSTTVVCLGAAAAPAADRHPGRPRTSGAKGGLPKELGPLQRLLERGRAATADQWPALRTAYGWVPQAAHLLANHDGRPGDAVRADYRALLATMTAQRETLGALAPAVDQFQKVTASYWPGLFHCYDVPDLPRTNNELEQSSGSARYHERRARGRKGASPGLVGRGAARVVAAVATRDHGCDEATLRPADRAAWQALRQQLATRQAARGAQRRFRRDPDGYLAALEVALSKSSLPA